MPFVKYTPADKAHAIALAGVVGSEEAGKRLGIDGRAIRRWMEEAGKPELAIPRDQLEAAADLALSTLTKDIADGRVRGTRLATAVGILQDKVRLARKDRPEPEPDDRTPEEREAAHVVDQWEALIAEHWPTERDQDRALAYLIQAIERQEVDEHGVPAFIASMDFASEAAKVAAHRQRQAEAAAEAQAAAREAYEASAPTPAPRPEPPPLPAELGFFFEPVEGPRRTKWSIGLDRDGWGPPGLYIREKE